MSKAGVRVVEFGTKTSKHKDGSGTTSDEIGLKPVCWRKVDILNTECNIVMLIVIRTAVIWTG